ncbi:unnamed protein product [Urochloa humidicola]
MRSPRTKVATFPAMYANWGFAMIKGIGSGLAGVVWLYSIVFDLLPTRPVQVLHPLCAQRQSLGDPREQEGRNKYLEVLYLLLRISVQTSKTVGVGITLRG